MPDFDPTTAAELKRIALTAIFLDDDLLEGLVLKGGNAIDLVYNLAKRSSMDLDLSMGSELSEQEADQFKSKIREAIESHFESHGYKVYDWRAKEHPPEKDSDSKPSFWGGYQVSFKVITPEEYEKFKDNPSRLGSNGIPLSSGGSNKLEIDFSKFEYVGKSSVNQYETEDGYVVFVYTPMVLVLGKIRALCQNTKTYYKQIGRNRHPGSRARDFFDIYQLLESDLIPDDSICNEESIRELEEVFSCKQVNFDLLNEIEKYKSLHESTFAQLKETLYEGVDIKDFDFYFEYVMEKISKLKECLQEAGIMDSPSS